MAYCTSGRLSGPLHALRAQFGQHPDLPFGDVLTAEQVEQTLRDEQGAWRDRLFNPVLTLWAFLSQALSPDGSCRAAVARVVAWRTRQGRAPCAAGTGAYCKARQRLPEACLR